MFLNALTIVMDILWCFTMKSVWSGKPAKNPQNWMAFDRIRGFTLFLSWVNIIIKIVAILFLIPIYNTGKRLAGAAASGNNNQGLRY